MKKFLVISNTVISISFTKRLTIEKFAIISNSARLWGKKKKKTINCTN